MRRFKTNRVASRIGLRQQFIKLIKCWRKPTREATRFEFLNQEDEIKIIDLSSRNIIYIYKP